MSTHGTILEKDGCLRVQKTAYHGVCKMRSMRLLIQSAHWSSESRVANNFIFKLNELIGMEICISVKNCTTIKTGTQAVLFWLFHVPFQCGMGQKFPREQLKRICRIQCGFQNSLIPMADNECLPASSFPENAALIHFANDAQVFPFPLPPHEHNIFSPRDNA